MMALHTQLDDLNITLADVLKELRVRPQGKLVQLSGTQTGTPPVPIFVGEPWFGFSLTNDGPSDLQYNVGDGTSWCSLKANETRDVDMRSPIVSNIVFQCAPGQSAAWRLTGIR